MAEQLLEIMKANHQITEEQYKELKKKAEEEKASHAGTAAQAASAAQAAAAAQQVTAQTAKTLAEERPLAYKPAAEGGLEPGMNFKMKGISVNIGGFIEAASIYRSRNLNSDIGSPFQKIPLPNQPAYYQDETRFTARQSRLSVLAQGDPTDTVHLAGYYEMDFLGAAPTANSNESNSYNMRIRHLYATSDWDTCGLHFLAGQSWSLVTQNTGGITPRKEDIPLTIDAQYVPGFTWARQPQFRITKDWDKTFWLAASVESPQTTVASQPNAVGTNYAIGQGPGSLFASTLSVNDIPDIVVKAAYEPCWGHFEVFNLTRNFQSSLLPAGSTSLNNSSTTSEAVGGGVNIPIIPKQLNIMASGLYGDGIGRYGSGQLPDVTQDKSGAIHPITAMHLLGGLTWQPLSQLQFYGYYGREEANRNDLAQGGKGYGYGSNLYDEDVGPINNKLFQGAGQVQTVEQFTLGEWWSFYQGRYGVMKLGMQYSFTQDKYFSGINGAKLVQGGAIPGDHMFFTSLRYYWQ